MAYTTATNVRALTNLTVSDISDTDITSLIAFATQQLNHDINYYVIREKIEQIDNTRKNSIDGSNATFYVKNWEGKYIGDFNDSGTVSKEDLTVYQIDSSSIETVLTISSVAHNEGKFVLSSAPSSGVILLITYCWSYVDESTPGSLISLAATYLTSALAFEKINAGRSPNFAFGSSRFTRDMEAGNRFYRRYREIVTQINERLILFKEAEII